jgi:hypothetical protein
MLQLCTDDFGLTRGFGPMPFEQVFSKIQCVVEALLFLVTNLLSANLSEKHSNMLCVSTPSYSQRIASFFYFFRCDFPGAHAYVHRVHS